MLAVWPLVTIALFASLPAHRALAWSVLSAYLILPVGTSFEISGVPSIDKNTVSNLSILLSCVLFVRKRWLRALRQPLLLILIFAFVLSPFLTAYFNNESLFYADRVIPAMTMYDAVAQAVVNIITLIPFVVACGIINDDQKRLHLLAIFLLSALIYSVPMLIEIRFSPQLHRLIYGFFPHSFGQQMRDGGFRPIVFLGHGLLVAIFCAMAVIAAIARWRETNGRQRTKAGQFAVYLGVLLLLCKSTGAVILATAFIPVVALSSAKRIAAISALACLIVLLYPAIRAAGVVPTETISELTASFSSDRAGSLGLRLTNEAQLLGRAAAKPILGWGSWGRNRIFSQDDGKDLSTTDGAWIITLGMWGWMGYLAMFGLLSFGSFKTFLLSSKEYTPSISSAVCSALLAVNMLDSIPNASIRPITWLLAGVMFAVKRDK